MQIQSLSIRNFKSIRELEILDVESSLILVGKNNTGKTAVLDAIRAVTGNYTVGAHDFNEKRQNIKLIWCWRLQEKTCNNFMHKVW